MSYSIRESVFCGFLNDNHHSESKEEHLCQIRTKYIAAKS